MKKVTKKYNSIQEFFDEKVSLGVKIRVRLQFIILDIINFLKHNNIRKYARFIINIILISLIIIDVYYWFTAVYNEVAYHALAFIGLMYLTLEFNSKYINKIGSKLFKN